MNKGIIRYTSRDYDSLIAEMKDLVPKLTDLWKPEATADPGYVLMTLLASSADMLGVNLDWLANEVFAPSVTQRKNAEKLFGLIGYTLGWYTAARTEVTFTNNSETDTIVLDFGFNGANFATLNAYTDITQQPRVITYNILPLTNKYGTQDTRSKRDILSSAIDTFSTVDRVTLNPKQSVTRVAIEGELRSTTISVEDVKKNNYIIKLPSQHLDTSAVWIRAKSTLHSDTFRSTQWVQVSTAAEFTEPEPRFAVTYDNYSNAQIQISNYINQLPDYDNNYLTIYWIECSGVIGSVSSNVLRNFQPAIPPENGSAVNSYDEEALMISNLANTVELPHTHTVTGKSPETGKEAYANSRKYINTWDSLITIPDFNRFLNREPGVDCGLVIDCQKALEINLAIYHDTSLSDSQKAKMYITKYDFPISSTDTFNWRGILDEVDTSNGLPFTCNFKTYTAMCYMIHNDFNDIEDYTKSDYIDQHGKSQIKDAISYIKYKPPISFIDGVNADFRPCQAASVELDFGYARIFPWYVVGQIYPYNPVTQDVAKTIIEKVKEALALYFAPCNRAFGQKPTVMEVVDVIEGADSRIKYFDAGSLKNPVINWGERRTVGAKDVIVNFDIEYFNPISFARYKDVGSSDNIRIAPDWIIR